jgi:hypothetical protein
MVQQLAARRRLQGALRRFDLLLGTGKSEVARFVPAAPQHSGKILLNGLLIPFFYLSLFD